MISVVEHVHKISVKWMDVVQLGEAFNNKCQLFGDTFLHELYFAHVELANTLNFESCCDDGGRLSLSFAESDLN